MKQKKQPPKFLLLEHKELKDRLINIRELIKSKSFEKENTTQQYLIKKQAKAMAYYEKMLSERIKDLL